MTETTDSKVHEKIQQWLEGPYDQETKSIIRELLNTNPEALTDAFYTDIAFGTGGMRGLMGVGTNRINRYTICRATQGFANYLLRSDNKEPLKILISHDNRQYSRDFALETAKVLLGNKIHVLLTEDLRPTPFVSFACRYHQCHGAVMITASHNPKEYNGYKVYWSDGAQVVPPNDSGIIHEVNSIKGPEQIHLGSLEDDHLEILDQETDLAYRKAVKNLQHFPANRDKTNKELKIVYTPLHGTGSTFMPQAFDDWGFHDVHMVESQFKPDEDFSNAPIPNPEDPQALTLGVRLLQEINGDLLLATDPDADRVGAVILHQGRPQYLSGNEMAAILLNHICRVRKEQKNLSKDHACITTIVTTELLHSICREFGIAYFEVLTGFKYIGEKIRIWQQQPVPPYQFLFGAEESYGYLYGTYCRDKDGIAASCLIAEAALDAKMQNKTIIDTLHELYKKHGIFREDQVSVKFEDGKKGHEKMQALIKHLRENPPEKINDIEVIEKADYLSGIRDDIQTMKKHSIPLPKSNVLSFRLADRSKIIVRPSGTEPKVKIYVQVWQRSSPNLSRSISDACQRLESLLSACKHEISL